MRVELSGGSSDNRTQQAQGSGHPPAAAGEELSPIRDHTLDHGGSWGLLLIPIAICVVLAGYASLFMR